MKIFKKIVNLIALAFAALIIFSEVAMSSDFKESKIIYELKYCYDWNPVLWDYILKKEDIRELWAETAAVCVGRLDLKTLKKEHRLARETKSTGEFYVKIYATMKEISKFNKNQ